MPTYGRSFTVPNGSDMKPPISQASAGRAGIAGEAGSLGYLEICLGIKSGGWTGVMTFLRKFKIHIFKQKKMSNYGSISKIQRKNHYLQIQNSEIGRKNHYLQVQNLKLEGKTTTSKLKIQIA